MTIPYKFRIHLFSWLCLVMLSGIQPASAGEDPRSIVIDTTEQVLARLRAERDVIKADPGKVYDIINTAIVPRTDFERMSRWVLGKHWRTATDQQKSDFKEEFQRLIIRTYGTALLQYTDEKLEYPPLKPQADPRDVTVETIIKPPGGTPIPVNYGLFLNDQNEWKVYDMIIDSISLISNYRSSFDSQIRRGGLDDLIQRMREHAAEKLEKK